MVKTRTIDVMKNNSISCIDVIAHPCLRFIRANLSVPAYQDSGIVNGAESRRNSKPYMVSVQNKTKHICGGFLVSESFVMTAAHCYIWGVNLTVMVGAHDITIPRSSSYIIDVKDYHIHPGYNAKTLENDIMLLQLVKTTPKSKAVQQIPLPKKDQDIKAKSFCTVAGWGATKTGGSPNPCLLEVNVAVVDRSSCQRSWGKTGTITPSMICAGGTAADYKGVCQGDSGGPLVCKGTAVGVVSFNQKDNCNEPQKPNVYTKISKYLSWIKCIMKY
ncbi:complement factor D isoform X1 [Coregonus clupeaformis]|uniref:complement factor D isoform X1 n=1 Tax=Coregonus clupeaformis TaxID=59861 RepID=UPI001BDFFD1F|nr:complement factor D isoform X1 [Coregonus clupeaformis]